MLPLLGAALSLAPGILGGVSSALGARQQQHFDAEQAQKQMDFQERMSSTQWQRGVADMKAAGINPMLSFMQGGASSPSGAMATGENVAGAGVSSAMEALQTKKTLDLLSEQRRLAKNQADKTFNESQLVAAEMSKPGIITSRGSADLPQTYWGMWRQAQIDNMMANAASARAGAQIANRDAQQETSPFGRGLNWVRRFRESLFGGSNPAAAAGQVLRAVP